MADFINTASAVCMERAQTSGGMAHLERDEFTSQAL